MVTVEVIEPGSPLAVRVAFILDRPAFRLVADPFALPFPELLDLPDPDPFDLDGLDPLF